jgi:hypothetical protein
MLHFTTNSMQIKCPVSLEALVPNALSCLDIFHGIRVRARVRGDSAENGILTQGKGDFGNGEHHVVKSF